MNSEPHKSKRYAAQLAKRPEVDRVIGPHDLALAPAFRGPRVYAEGPDGVYIVSVDSPTVDELVTLLNSNVARAAIKNTVRVCARETAQRLYEQLQGRACMVETRLVITYRTERGEIIKVNSDPDTTLSLSATADDFGRHHFGNTNATGVDDDNADPVDIHRQAIRQYALWLVNRLKVVPNATTAAKAIDSITQTECSDGHDQSGTDDDR